MRAIIKPKRTAIKVLLFSALIADEPIFAYAFEGKRYDCGSKLGYLEANVEFALKHPQLGRKFADYLRRRVAEGLEPL